MDQNDPITSLVDRSAEWRHSVRRGARRALRRGSGEQRTAPPPHPVGGKLEITYACNLRCGFCYTDSPRHTLQRTLELSDADWLAVADQLIDAGAIEAVITGGEPLLRKDLTVEICRRLARAGLGLTLNSNGWFIDDEVAAGLAETPGLHVHVSVDGPSPEVHDASRGVPGSWRRAVAGIDALIRHGVPVHAVHVVSAGNLDHVDETLDALSTLGVMSIRVTRVIEIGAAAREGGWRVASTRLERTVEGFRRRNGDSVPVVLRSGEGGTDRFHSVRAPAALLVRPNGMVRTDSLNPFTFGHAIGDGLEACWERVGEHWRDPAITSWQSTISAPTDWSRAKLVPYLDDEVEVVPTAGPGETGGDPREARIPQPVPVGTLTRSEIGDPRAHIEGLALARRYRHGDVRVGGTAGRRLIRRRDTGGVWRLNESASVVFDALSVGTTADAAGALAETFPSMPAVQLRGDALEVTRSLSRQGLVLPVEARAVATQDAGSSPDLPQVELG